MIHTLHEPTEPDAEPILQLHRGPDGYVAFGSHTGEKWSNLFSVRADELQGYFPTMREHLLHDAYFSVNAFFRGFGKSKAIPELKSVDRQGDSLRYLNACFADIDGHALGLTEGEVMGRAHDLVQEGILPPVSLYVFSGRGVWLLWLLRDKEDARMPVRAFPEKRGLYGGVQRAIRDCLADLGADAIDEVRVMRVPGSVNTKSGRRVRFMVPADDEGRPFVYTLDELADRFGVTRRKYHPVEQAAIDDATASVRRKAWHARWAANLRQLLMLQDIRGSYADGCRNRAVMLYAHFLAKTGAERRDLIVQVYEMGERCRPRLKGWECRDAIRSGLKLKTGPQSISNQTIANWLHITPDESELLESWPPAKRFGGPELRTTRADALKARRALIQEHVDKTGSVPPTRTMAGVLADYGHEVTHVTVHNDYKALKLLADQAKRRDDELLLEPFDQF